ncbi:MAG: metalloregulator ArsR/SmtB family transcription factor [Candidatus Omnitrophota bacterium]
MEELAYKIKSDFLKALAHPIRLQIIELLKSGEEKVGDIIKRIGIPQSSLSGHLLALREAGILRSRQQGTLIYYAIEDESIFQILRPIAKLLKKKIEKTATVLNSLGKER